MIGVLRRVTGSQFAVCSKLQTASYTLQATQTNMDIQQIYANKIF